MNSISNLVWIFFILITCINAIIIRVRATSYIKENPDLKKGYNKSIKNLLIYGNIPWLIIAFGNTTGITKGMEDFFTPRSLNPVVLVFHAYIIFVWVKISYWIYFNKGSEFLKKHPFLNRQPGLIRQYYTLDIPWLNKLLWSLMLAGGIVAMFLMWRHAPSL